MGSLLWDLSFNFPTGYIWYCLSPLLIQVILLLFFLLFSIFFNRFALPHPFVFSFSILSYLLSLSSSPCSLLCSQTPTVIFQGFKRTVRTSFWFSMSIFSVFFPVRVFSFVCLLKLEWACRRYALEFACACSLGFSRSSIRIAATSAWFSSDKLHGLLDPGFLGWVIGSGLPMDFLCFSFSTWRKVDGVGI